MKSTDCMMKYLGEGLSAFDKIAPAFEKEVNKAIKEGNFLLLHLLTLPRRTGKPRILLLLFDQCRGFL